MNDVKDYCKNKSAPEGSSLHYATLYESENNKKCIYSLFALHYELFNCLIITPDPGVTRIKLHWWSEELDRLKFGKPRHPVTTALLPFIANNPQLMECLQRHYIYIESLLRPHKSDDLNSWKDHHVNLAGELWLNIEKQTGQPGTDSIITTNGGIIFTLDLIQNYSFLLSKLSGLFPHSLLEKYKLTENSLKIFSNNSLVSDMINELLLDLESDLNKIYFSMNIQNPKPGLYNAIMNRISCVLCKEIRDDGSQIMQHKIAITPLRKLWISWRTKIIY